jgi:hypothetical protein
MRVAVSVPIVARDDLLSVLQTSSGRNVVEGAAPDALGGAAAVLEEEDILGDVYTATALIQPGTFRTLYNYVSQQTGSAGRLDVVAVAAQDVAVRGVQQGGASEAAGERQGFAAEAAAPVLGSGSGFGVMGGGIGGGYAAASAASVVMPVASRGRADPSGEVRILLLCHLTLPF